MAEGFLHVNGHNYQLSPRYLADDGTALAQLRTSLDELAGGPPAPSSMRVDVVIRGEDTPLVVTAVGLGCYALGVTVY